MFGGSKDGQCHRSVDGVDGPLVGGLGAAGARAESERRGGKNPYRGDVPPNANPLPCVSGFLHDHALPCFPAHVQNTGQMSRFGEEEQYLLWGCAFRRSQAYTAQDAVGVQAIIIA